MHYQSPCRQINLNCPEKIGLLLKAYNVLKRTIKLKQLFRNEKYDYVFGFMESANYPTALAEPNSMLSVHCNPHELGFFETLLMKMTYPRAKHIIAVSEDVATLLREEYKMPSVSRIYNLVSFKEIQKQGVEPFTHPRSYIVALGRLSEVKRLDILINAYASSELRHHCDLLIVGEGECRQELEQQIADLSLQDQVILEGVQSNPFKYLANAEFLVLSSRTEAFPMVLIEALVLSCPVVATDCPTGPREIVIEGENGLLVENENTEALSQAMDRLYGDKALLQHCRNNAVNSVQHLSADEVVKEWLELGDRP